MEIKKELIRISNYTYPEGLEWELVGIVTKNQKVYTLSYDSKILSGIFEILCEPLIQKLCAEFDYQLVKGVQNQYPEFTIYKNPQRKIAIDVKTTYRQWSKNGELKSYGFTLGSYRSYLRNPDKGIRFPYNEYEQHWIWGFIYTRNLNCKNISIKPLIESYNLEAPYKDIEYFIQEKWKIAGRTPGSGNTTNIGSIKSNNINDFIEGKSPFTSQSDFEDYWKHYGK